MNFGNMGIHVTHNPAGTFSYVGTLPTVLATAKPATRADVMGCRSLLGPDGAQYAWKFPVFDTRQQAIDYAKSKGIEINS